MPRMLLPLAAALVLGCGNDRAEISGVGTTTVAADLASPPAAPMAVMTEQAARLQTGAIEPAADRKLIRSAEIRIQLDDVVAGTRKADSIAASFAGQVTSSRIVRGDRGDGESQVTSRVPTARFAETLEALRGLGRVKVDNTHSEDVTRAYNDLEIRLAVKRDLVGRLRALLATRTARLADVIQVERELARAIAELEQMEGERRYLDNQVAMSTIHASFFHVPVAGPGSFLEPVAVAFRQALHVLGRSVGVLVSALVFATPWVVIAAVLWRFRHRIRRRPAHT